MNAPIATSATVRCPAPGTCALVSMGRYDDPTDWVIVKVLWSDVRSTLAEFDQPRVAGGPDRLLVETASIRSTGSYADCFAFRKYVKTEVDAIRAPLTKLEDAATEAKARVWKVLDRSYGAVVSPGDAR